MYLRLFLTMAATVFGAVFGTSPGHGQTPQAGLNRITFQSASYVDFRQVLAREPATASVAVPATLGFPVEVRDKYPAVVVVHSIAGYLDANEGRYAAELREAGFATLTYDSFAARGMTRVALSRSPGFWPSAVADAYSALRLLASHPGIDANRIAIVGFSFGGEVAHLTALEDLRSALNPGRAQFAAHVAYYPAGVFGAVAGQRAYTGSPILMLLGGKDGNLPVAKVHEYLAYARSATYPAPIASVTYPGAYHAWTVSSLGSARFYPEYPSTKKCPLILIGPDRPVLLVDGQAKPFDPTSFGACMGEAPGYSMAYDAAIRTRSADDAMEFLRRHLRPL